MSTIGVMVPSQTSRGSYTPMIDAVTIARAIKPVIHPMRAGFDAIFGQ